MKLRVLVSLLVLSQPAYAQVSSEQKVRCANAYEQAQRTRNEGLFRASREHLLVCADDACPGVLRSECVKWLGEIDAATPTVILIAKDDAGNEVSDVAVSIDGTRALDRLDGKALPVDPGTRTFRFSRKGSDTIEQKVLVREGEKRRVITVTFGASGAAGSSEPPSDKPASKRSGVPTGTWILGGVGVVALGLAVPMYLGGYKRKGDLDDGCGRTQTCDPDDVSSVRRQILFGDIAAGVSLVALTSAVIIWATAPSEPATVSAGFAPLPGGVAGALRVVF